MQLSVIIPCLNAAETVADQLEALARQHLDAPWELIVSDNGSTDGTLDVVRRYAKRFPNFRVVDASDKRGAAHAMNVGILSARSDFLAFCDADDEMGDGWLAAMAGALQRYQFVVGALEYKKLNPSWLKASHPQERGLNRFRNPPYLHHGGAGNMGIRRAIYESVGGFDESMPHLFDTDFCFKVQLSGIELRFVPEAVMHIRTSTAFPVILRKALANGEDQVLLYKKYQTFGMPRLSWKAGVRGWFQLVVALSRVRDRGDLAAWTWAAGWRLGRLKGSIKHRIFAL